MDRKWLFFGAAAVILAGLIGGEIWINIAHPLYKISSINLSSDVLGSARVYNYMKDGVIIGTFMQMTERGPTYGVESFLVTTIADVQTGGKSFVVKTRLTVNSFNTPLTYFVNATLDGSPSSIRVQRMEKIYEIQNTIKGQVFSTQVEPPNPVVIVDNNIPAHWELIIRGVKMESGERYGLIALVPQQNGVKEFELSVDEKTSSITVEGVDYICTVVRENTFDLSFYLSDGKLIRFRNQSQNIEISLKSG